MSNRVAGASGLSLRIVLLLLAAALRPALGHSVVPAPARGADGVVRESRDGACVVAGPSGADTCQAKVEASALSAVSPDIFGLLQLQQVVKQSSNDGEGTGLSDGDAGGKTVADEGGEFRIGLAGNSESPAEWDVGKTVKDAATKISEGARHVGEGAKNFATDAANTVSHGAIQAVEGGTKVATDVADAVSRGFGQAAQSVGRGVQHIGHFFWDGANRVGSMALSLTKPVVASAQLFTETAKNVIEFPAPHVDVEALTHRFQDKVRSVGKEMGSSMVKLGPLSLGIASDGAKELLKTVSCLSSPAIWCKVVLGSMCDCDKGSKVEFLPDGGFNATCAVRGQLTKNIGVSMSGSLVSPRKGPLAERVWEMPPIDATEKRIVDGCTAPVADELEGNVEWAPRIEIEIQPKKNIRITVKADVTVSLAAFISTQGRCDATLRPWSPKPLIEVICHEYGCIVIAVLAHSTLDLHGDIDGSIYAGLAAEFGFEATIDTPIGGGSKTEAVTVRLKHQHGAQLNGTFNGTLAASMGPQVVIWPMPGWPVDILAKATGTFAARVSSVARGPEDCSGAEFAISGSTHINGLRLPEGLSFDDTLVRSLIDGAVNRAQRAFLAATAFARCFGPIGDHIPQIAKGAGDATKRLFKGMIPKWRLSLGSKGLTLLDKNVFCAKVWESGTCGPLVCTLR